MVNVVGEVGEEGLPRLQLVDDFEGLVDAEVGGVVAVAQGVEDQEVEVLEKRPGFGGDARHVGAVGQGLAGVVDAEAGDGEAAVQETQGGEGGVVELDRAGDFEGEGDQFGDEGIVDVAVRGEDVFEHAGQRVVGRRLGVDFERGVHGGVEAAQVVEAEDVVGVGVGDEDRVEATEFRPQGLVAQVGGGVDENLAALGLRGVEGDVFFVDAEGGVVPGDQDAGAVAAVAGVR